MAVRALRLLKTDHPHIDYEVVLPYLSAEFGDFYREDETVFPEILDECPPKYCIDRRNRWMVKESDYVVCYVKYDFTRSAKYVDLAKSKGKTVINLATDKI